MTPPHSPQQVEAIAAVEVQIKQQQVDRRLHESVACIVERGCDMQDIESRSEDLAR